MRKSASGRAFRGGGRTANRPAIAGVVAVHDVRQRTKDGQTYILMEYLMARLSGRIAKFRRTDGHSLFPGGPNLRPVPSQLICECVAGAGQTDRSDSGCHPSQRCRIVISSRKTGLWPKIRMRSVERIKILDFGNRQGCGTCWSDPQWAAYLGTDDSINRGRYCVGNSSVHARRNSGTEAVRQMRARMCIRAV